MIDLFQLQTDSNELWPRIQRAIAEASATLAEITAERDSYKATIDAFLAADEARRADMVAAALKSATEKRIEEVKVEIEQGKAELEKDLNELNELTSNSNKEPMGNERASK